MEIWKDIEGYEDSYKISNQGRLFSYKRNRILKGWRNNEGYIHIRLWKNEEPKAFKVHRIVAFHFMEKINDKNSINHINGIKDDNRVENLEWCNQSENMKHAYSILNRNKMGFQKNWRKMQEKCYDSIQDFHS